jgi:hypothetical protein
MQLTGWLAGPPLAVPRTRFAGGRSRGVVRLTFAVAFCAAAALTAPRARADKDNKPDAPAVSVKDIPAPPIARDPGKPEDTSTKHVALEMAGYTDSENVTAGASISGHYLVDVVSAASVDVVSTASGKWNEVRQAGGLEGTYKPHETGVTAAGAVSSEPDYLSYSFGAEIIQELDEKNTTLLFGYGYGHDTVGYHFTPSSVFSRIILTSTFSAGWTQVLDRSTVGSLAVDLSIEDGDGSKPYRYIPMFSPAEAALVPNGASVGWVTANRLPERPAEQLPLARDRYSVSGRIAHRFDSSTLRLDQRFYADSWKMLATSSDARWIFELSRRVHLWPHLRFHAQNAVNFWSRAYVSQSSAGFVLPEFRTGNRELGPMLAWTGGGGLKFFLGSAGNPKSLDVAVQLDSTYTRYLDDLYEVSRTSILGALILEGEL